MRYVGCYGIKTDITLVEYLNLPNVIYFSWILTYHDDLLGEMDYQKQHIYYCGILIDFQFIYIYIYISFISISPFFLALFFYPSFSFLIFVLFHYLCVFMEGRKEMFYLTTHSTHFIYGYMASDIWLRTILIVRKETRCRYIGYSFRLAARVLLYAPSNKQDSTYHGLCYTSRGALAGTRNSSIGPLHEGSIRRPIAP